MNIIDFVKNPQPNLWQRFLNDLARTDDHLKENYLNIDFGEFLTFPCFLDSEKIVCFSGLQYNENKWGQGVARCSSRMWIHPDYRIQGASKFAGGPKFLNTTYCLPMQLELAETTGINTLFISRESNPRAFGQYINLVKINCGIEFNIEPMRYNVCGHQHSPMDSCNQFVAVYHRDLDAKRLWIKNMSQHVVY